MHDRQVLDWLGDAANADAFRTVWLGEQPLCYHKHFQDAMT